MAAFKCLFVIFGSFLIVPEIVGHESETTTNDNADLITTTTILPLSSTSPSKTNATLDDNNDGDAEKDVKENGNFFCLFSNVFFYCKIRFYFHPHWPN